MYIMVETCIFIMNLRIRQKQASYSCWQKQVMKKYTETEVAGFAVVYIIDDMSTSICNNCNNSYYSFSNFKNASTKIVIIPIILFWILKMLPLRWGLPKKIIPYDTAEWT